MPDERDELTRIRAFYAERDRRMADGASDEAPSVATRFLLQQRQQAVLAMLRRHGLGSLGEATILDLGCGYGGVLREYQIWGAAPARLYGIDLLLGRLRTAHARLPGLPLTCADGQYLPYRSSVFDLVLQYTVFTSVLDDQVKANLAREMLRVLRRPAGLILWYDFWINPTNRQTRGIRPAEIRRLFPGCQYDFQRITLAPPIARRVVPRSWRVGTVLERLAVFNSHYLVAIRPQPAESGGGR